MNLNTDENCDYCDVLVPGREPCVCHGLLLCDEHFDLYHNSNTPDQKAAPKQEPEQLRLPGIDWDKY